MVVVLVGDCQRFKHRVRVLGLEIFNTIQINSRKVFCKGLANAWDDGDDCFWFAQTTGIVNI